MIYLTLLLRTHGKWSLFLWIFAQSWVLLLLFGWDNRSHWVCKWWGTCNAWTSWSSHHVEEELDLLTVHYLSLLRSPTCTASSLHRRPLGRYLQWWWSQLSRLCWGRPVAHLLSTALQWNLCLFCVIKRWAGMRCLAWYRWNPPVSWSLPHRPAKACPFPLRRSLLSSYIKKYLLPTYLFLFLLAWKRPAIEHHNYLHS